MIWFFFSPSFLQFLCLVILLHGGKNEIEDANFPL